MSDKRTIDNYKTLPQQVIENTEYILSFEDRISGWDDKINSAVEKVDGQDSKISTIEIEVKKYDDRIDALESNSKTQASKITDIEAKDATQDSKLASLETDVNAISNSYVSTNAPQDITGTKTFTSPIKTNEIDNTNGNALLRYKSTEGKNVVGGSNVDLTLMGKSDRPTYSKDGANFTGNELALKSDVDSHWNTLMANLGIGRWANQTFYKLEGGANPISDPLAVLYTDYTRCFANVTYKATQSWSSIVDITCDFEWNHTRSSDGSLEGWNKSSTLYCFYNFDGGAVGITIPGCNGFSSSEDPTSFISGPQCSEMFEGSKFTFVKVKDGEKFLVCRAYCMFRNMPNLTSISGFIFNSRGFFDTQGMFDGCSNLESITNCVLPRHTFYLNVSSKFTEEALVEIIKQLPKTSEQTLYLGATNMAKLSEEQIKVATDKGWNVA